MLGVFTATLLGFTLLRPVHLLFINAITDASGLAWSAEGEPDGTRHRIATTASSPVAWASICGVSGRAYLRHPLWRSYHRPLCGSGILPMPSGVSPHGMTMAFDHEHGEIFHNFQYALSGGAAFLNRSHNRSAIGYAGQPLHNHAGFLEVGYVLMPSASPRGLGRIRYRPGLTVLVICGGTGENSSSAGPLRKKRNGKSYSRNKEPPGRRPLRPGKSTRLAQRLSKQILAPNGCAVSLECFATRAANAASLFKLNKGITAKPAMLVFCIFYR